MVEHIYETTFCQNIVWQEQFGVVGNVAETLVDDRVVVAPGGDEDGKLLCHLGVIIEKFHESLAQLFTPFVSPVIGGQKHLRNASLSGFIHDDGSACSISIRQNRTA